MADTRMSPKLDTEGWNRNKFPTHENRKEQAWCMTAAASVSISNENFDLDHASEYVVFQCNGFIVKSPRPTRWGMIVCSRFDIALAIGQPFSVNILTAI